MEARMNPKVLNRVFFVCYLLACLFVVVSMAGCGEEYTTPTNNLVFDKKFFSDKYLEVQECTGLTAPEPNTIVTSDHYWPWPKYTGLYDPYSKIVFINIRWKHSIKHEFIHYLLDIHNGDYTHDSIFFTNCI